MITDAKMKFWIDNNLNVLFIGHAGVGKTARVKEAFDQAGLKWLYFSAATMDPWVDFIGVPKEFKDETSGKSYLDLVRPKVFAEDTVEAIFMDEFNRSNKKVRNAVLELIQFRSINGRVFKNLRMIWAAINPDDVKTEDGSDDLEYDVERLDPAQKDRFEVHVDVPYKPDRGYFLRKFGDDICENAIDWWNDLDQVAKRSVSPRRLDYALNVYVKGGDMRDVLPPNVNVSKLITELKNGSYVKLMKDIFNRKNTEEGKKFLAVRNNYDNTISRIIKSDDMIQFFVPCIGEEDLVNLMANENKVFNYIIDNCGLYDSIIKNIIDVNSTSKLAKKLKKEPKLTEMAQNLKAKAISIQFNQLTFSNPSLSVKPVVKNQYGVQFSSLGGQSFTNFINDSTTLSSAIRKGTQYRIGIYHKILQNVTDSETTTDYMTALKVVVDIISSSNKQSLKQIVFKGLPELFGYLLNRCVTTSNGSETSTSIISKIKIKNGRSDKLEDFMFVNSNLYV